MLYIKFIFFGSLITLSFYHFIVFCYRKDDKKNLYYALMTSSFALIIFFARIYPFLFKNIFISKSILIISTYFCAWSMSFFIYTIFNAKKVQRLSNFFLIIIGIILIVTLIRFFIFKNPQIFKLYFAVMACSLIIIIFLLIRYIFIKKLYKIKENKPIIYSYTSALLSVLLLTAFNAFYKVPVFLIAYFPFLIMIFFFAISLVENFNNDHKKLKNLTNTLEQKVIDRTKKLEESHKQKMDFINNVLHEIRTPVTILTNSLKDYIKKQGRSSDIEVVKKNADKLEKDVLNLLDTQKFERGNVLYEHDQIINLGDMIINKAIIFMSIAKKKNIKIFRDIPPTKDIYIKIDPYAMDRIISNILDNAIRYTKENGIINIFLKKRGDKIDLIISDTGIGISEEQQKYIFEPYYQISRKKSSIQGIGMGLTIVKKILDEVNGNIKVESKLGEGTSFIITLDVYKLQEKDIVTENIKYSDAIDSVIDVELKEEEYKPGKNNIFIVEDDLNMLLHLQNNMYDIYNFYYAKNGKEALEKLEKIPKPDIIILDIMMDEMDGYTFYDVLSLDKKFKYIPILFLTAISRQEEKIKGLSKGAIDYITKPFSMEELLAKVGSIIKIEEGKKENDIIELANEVRNYLINKTNKKLLLEEEKNKIEEENRNALDKLYIEYGISKREVEVLNLLFKGLMRKEIAYELNITMNTVKSYMSRIYTKCNAASKKELLKIFNIEK